MRREQRRLKQEDNFDTAAILLGMAKQEQAAKKAKYVLMLGGRRVQTAETCPWYLLQGRFCLYALLLYNLTKTILMILSLRYNMTFGVSQP